MVIAVGYQSDVTGGELYIKTSELIHGHILRLSYLR